MERILFGICWCIDPFKLIKSQISICPPVEIKKVKSGLRICDSVFFVFWVFFFKYWLTRKEILFQKGVGLEPLINQGPIFWLDCDD